MHDDLASLKTLVESIVRGSSITDAIRSVRLEAAEDQDGVEYLRVILSAIHPEDLEWHQTREVIRAIEDSLGDKDDRFASVRFAEAA